MHKFPPPESTCFCFSIRHIILHALTLALIAEASFGLAQSTPNYDESAVRRYSLPDLLLVPNEKPILSSLEWEETARPFQFELLEKFIEQYYKKLRNGGTLVIFLDLWKITLVKELLEKYKFKQIRMIEWIKTNPQPLNSKVNYLTNCREIALVAIKVSKPTFNSSYDKGIYEFPLQGGKIRSHPTQKSLPLFEELIRKHSNPGDLVLDTFLGAGTTAMAAKNTDRRFLGCEVDDTYYATIQDNMNQIKEA